MVKMVNYWYCLEMSSVYRQLDSEVINGYYNST